MMIERRPSSGADFATKIIGVRRIRIGLTTRLRSHSHVFRFRNIPRKASAVTTCV